MNSNEQEAARFVTNALTDAEFAAGVRQSFPEGTPQDNADAIAAYAAEHGYHFDGPALTAVLDQAKRLKAGDGALSMDELDGVAGGVFGALQGAFHEALGHDAKKHFDPKNPQFWFLTW